MSTQLTLQQALQLAAQSLQKGELQQAEQLCRQVLQVMPNEPNALHLLGGVAYHTKNYQDAIQLIEQAININPDLFDAYYNLASIYQSLKEFELAVAWYEKGFSKLFQLDNTLNIEILISLMIQIHPEKWQDYVKHFINYANCLYQIGILQKMTTLAQLIQNINWQHENEVRFVVLTLLQVLKFDKLTARDWNVIVFEQVALPCMKQALACNYYELGFNLEGYIYNHYVKQKETEENFRTCFNQWVNEMCAAGRRVQATLPPLDKSVLHDNVPTIGFFIHNASLLAHIEVMLNMLEGLSQLEEKPFKPIVYAFGGYHEGMLARCQKIGVPVVFFAQTCSSKETYARLLFLREQVIKDGVSALVWISLATMMPFAFSMRVAPVQIWWAMKYHGLEFEDIDGYVTGSSSGEYKKFGNKVWRTGSLGRTDWYIHELQTEAQAIRQRYRKQFDMILGVMGREEILDSPPFIETISKILKRYPKVAFLWTGRHQLASIQTIFDKHRVSGQCFFIGWVNTRLYAQVFDVFLDSFPFPCGFTAFETAAAAKPVVLYSCKESYETGLVSNISPILYNQVGTERDRELMGSIFYSEEQNFYFCATNPDEYFNYACQLIESEDLRQRVGYAYSQFIECFFANIKKMASTYAVHFLDIINEAKNISNYDK